MATIDELKKKDGSAVNAGAVRPNPSQIPTGGYPTAPAPTQAAGALQKPAPVLDAQALADRDSFAKVGGALADTNQRLGASIADVATLIPRGLAGAYDTAVVRPMRAAGMDAAYLSPKLAPEGSDPASQTPFYDQIRKRDASTSPAGAPPTASQPVQQSNAETARLNRGTTLQPVQAAAPAAALPAQQPQAPMAAGALPQPGQVTRVGNSYSGANVSGDISINGAPPRGGVISAQDNQAAANLARSGGQTSGFGPAGAIRGGGQVSSIDTSAGYASDLRQLAEIEKNKAAQEVSMQGQADYAAMRAGQMSKKAYQSLLAGRQADATTRRGQDIQAGATRDSSRLAQDRLKLDASKAGQDATNANLDNESKTMLLNAQKAFANAKTPEERQAAMAVLSGLSGKSQQSAPWKGFALQGSTDAMGNKTEGVLAGFNEQTGEVRRMDQGTAKAATQAPPEGTTLTKDGKTYVVKNGVPVLL